MRGLSKVCIESTTRPAELAALLQIQNHTISRVPLFL